MPITTTCGSPDRATEFAYCGTVDEGITLIFRSGDVSIGASFLSAIRNEYQGRRVAGGFNMNNPPADGFGAWVQTNSRTLNDGQVLTPRHASFIAAILRDAGWLNCQLDGLSVMLNFIPG